MKTVCIYHSIDLDGWMSAAIVKNWWQKQQISYIQEGNHITNPNTGTDSIDFIGYNYGEPIPDLSEYDKIIMCDISFPKDEMYKLRSNLGTNFIWIDHHSSAIKDNEIVDHKQPIYNGVRDIKFAACELTWQYFFPNKTMPEIVRLLGRYDCFGHKGTDEELKVLEFQYGARQCISNYEEAYAYLMNSMSDKLYVTGQYFDNTLNQIYDKGKAIYQYLCTEAKQTYKNGFEVIFDLKHNENKESEKGYIKHSYDVARYKFICINRERFNPINFGIDYHKEGYDGCACFYYDGIAKLWRFRLYNDNDEVDCSLIAKQYGGGGHKGAAGFTITALNKIF